MTPNTPTSSRKLDHLRLCSETDVTAGSAGFEDIILVHNALPECDLDAIASPNDFLGRKLSSPLFISAIRPVVTRTSAEVNFDEWTAENITACDGKIISERACLNDRWSGREPLGSAAEKYGLAMGVGSQRAALEYPDLENSFSVVRDAAPHAFLCGNIGAVQLVSHGMEWVDAAVDMIDADAL